MAKKSQYNWLKTSDNPKMLFLSEKSLQKIT